MDEERRLDGNVLAGMLGELFRFEVTAAQCSCRACGADGPLGGLVVYASAMGAVARCPACQHVLIRVVQRHGEHWLDLGGVANLHIVGVPYVPRQSER